MSKKKVIELHTDGRVGIYDSDKLLAGIQDNFPELSTEIWLDITNWYADRMEILTGWHLTKKEAAERWKAFYNNGIPICKKIQKFVGKKYDVNIRFNTDMFWWDKESDKILIK